MALSEMGVSDHTGGSGSVYRRAVDSGFTEIEAAGRATGQNIWLTRMRSDNSGFHVGKGECPLCARSGHYHIEKKTAELYLGCYKNEKGFSDE